MPRITADRHRGAYAQPHSYSQSGFTALELLIAVGVMTILVSLVFPIIQSVRSSARKVQCSANLSQIQKAMVMYSNDYSRLGEVYPAYITNLYGSAGVGAGYISDLRAFICPADNTNAKRNSYGKTALKPVYSITPPIPIDDKNDWAEREGNGSGQFNCSYLYEFSTRLCQTYSFDTDSGFSTWNDSSPSSFCSTYLVVYDGENFSTFFGDDGQDPDPLAIDRIRNYTTTNGATQGYITWQDAKFYQLENGDIFCSGLEAWSDNSGFPAPPGDFTDPQDYYANNSDTYQDDSLKMGGYPRTWMPLVRCFWHQPARQIDNEGTEQVLNVALDGNVFNSAPYWERTAFKYGKSIQGTNSDPTAP